MMPRHRALAAWLFLAIAAAPGVRAAEPAISPQRQAVLEARLRKAAEARASGEWLVEPGEHLRLIARQFFPGDRPRQKRLREAIVEANPRAFPDGDPDRLLPGTRLAIPREALGEVPAPAAKPSSAAPHAREEARASSPATAVRAPEFAPGPPAPAPAPRPPAYVDQLIEGAGAEAQAAMAVEDAALLPGQRYASAEYRVEARSPPGGGHTIEHGVEVQMRRETLDYGEFHFEAALRDTSLAPLDASVGRRDGGRFTLYQDRFPVAPRWLADSAFGVVRTPPNFLNASYRIFLPTSIMAGASSVISDGASTFMAYGGHLGRLEGNAVQTFDPTSGNVAGLAYARIAGPWTLGGEAIALRGNAQVRDHEAATLAAEYGTLGAPMHDKLQVVADDRSHGGAWFDGDVTTGYLRNRFGLYQLDPGLQWGDAALAADQRGAYWRGDYRKLRYTVSGGVDLAQTNIRDDPSRAATRSASGYGTFSLRIDRSLSVGGGLTVVGSRSRFSDSPRGSTVSGNAYAAWTNPLGQTRFDATGYRATATGVADNTTDSVSWSQEWPARGSVAVSSTLTYARESQLGERTRRSSAGISARGTVLTDLLWDASIVYGRVSGPEGKENNFNVAANATWPIAPHWFALAQVSVNTFEALPLLPGTDAALTQRDKRVLLGFRYEEASGTPYQAMGLRTGAGSGRLTGVVFFDDNGDGVRQPTERGAPNVTLYLDGRFPVSTDAQGRFSFAAVPPGTHGLRILNEALPLPWTVDDEHPPVANVPLRGDAIVDIPLTKIRP